MYTGKLYEFDKDAIIVLATYSPYSLRDVTDTYRAADRSFDKTKHGLSLGSALALPPSEVVVKYL